MSLQTLLRGWYEFFLKPQSPVPVAIYRILFSLVVLIDAALLRPDWLTWFGPRGLVTLATSQQIETGARLNVFAYLPETEFWANGVYYALLAAAILLCVGAFTRASSIAVFVLLVSLHQRNIFILNGGDTLLRVCAFFLMFAPAGAALSIDRLRNIWRGREGVDIAPRAPWAQRMIQIELSLLYLMTFWNKTMGPSWVNGTALYYVSHLDQFRRFPLPDVLQGLAITKLETWFTLAAEFALGVLVWIREFRYPVLFIGVLLHLSLEYSMNVPMFQWKVLAAYVTFVDAADLARVWGWIRRRAAVRWNRPITVSFDPEVLQSRRAVEVLRVLDIFDRLVILNRQENVAAGAPYIGGIGAILRVAPRLWMPGARSRSMHVSAGGRVSRVRYTQQR
jgi:hypothetical protein